MYVYIYIYKYMYTYIYIRVAWIAENSATMHLPALLPAHLASRFGVSSANTSNL